MLVTSLTGCVVAPYEDHPNRHDGGYDQNKADDRDHKRPNWYHQKRAEWDKKRETRPNWERERQRTDYNHSR